MATLDALKCALRRKATETSLLPKRTLSDTEYNDGFNVLVRDSGWPTYEEFIIPQLALLLGQFPSSRRRFSVLEIGPGAKSVLGYLPDQIKRRIRRYTAFEPNGLFASKLKESLCSTSEMRAALPYLESRPNIHRISFSLDRDVMSDTNAGTTDSDEKFDIILFCHSLYGMKPKRRFIEKALEMLVERSENGMVVVFHRDQNLRLNGLVCHQTACFPTGVIRVADEDEVLDRFAPIIAGFVIQDVDVDKTVRAEWRKVCRDLGRREETQSSHLLFSSPNVMVSLTRHATALSELTEQVPLTNGGEPVKNREARFYHPASIIKPTDARQVQHCVRWALNHGVGLTVIGGGHSGHCLRGSVLAIDMGALDQVHIVTNDEEGKHSSDSSPLVVAEAGCKTGDIICKTMAAGLTVPLGARPSVGAGSWLQGGIGHLARLHGLACDAIVGIVLVSVYSGHVLCIGCVPEQYRPDGSVRLNNGTDLLWAMKGAGTNFGIILSVTFKAYRSRMFSVRNWVLPLIDDDQTRIKLGDLDRFANKLPRNWSLDMYLYWNNSQLHLGVTTFESTTGNSFDTSILTSIRTILGGHEDSLRVVDAVGLFETEMYISGMHGGHGGGKTSSFKRCLFLKGIGGVSAANILLAAMKTLPTPLCYLHLLQGGGMVGDVAEDATAFGCRDWDFACVVTGVWPREQDGTKVARGVVEWVYNVTKDLLPLSNGVYGADLGPDPRDAALAAKAFGPNRPRLAQLKHSLDPCHVLAYASSLPKTPTIKLILLVTGESGAGKDYCADIWVSAITRRSLKARAVGISNVTKREYAAAIGADLNRLLQDRAYKEQHRTALTTFFQEQSHRRPQLPQEHFLNVVYDAADVDVLVITGMRDEAPIAALSPHVPGSRLLEVRVEASEKTRRARRRYQCYDDDGDDNRANKSHKISDSNALGLVHHPSFTFNNDAAGNEACQEFAEHYLLPYLHNDLKDLAEMVQPISNFPGQGINFRHVLNISQQPGGLALCTSLLEAHSARHETKVDVVVACEAGGFVFASALATRVDKPLVLIRKAGKLPPPTICVTKSLSHISSLDSNNSKDERIEMERDVVPRGASVLVVDDVLASGKTLCAVLQLLDAAGIGHETISVIVVAEFPAHQGRDLLLRCGFGLVNIQSLLVFDGA